MINENKLRKAVRKHLFECMDEISGYGMMGEVMIDEERITNDEAKEFVNTKENFIGSHIWGEQIGESYVVCSYGEQFPLFLYDADEQKWYENSDEYLFNGEPVEQTKEHKLMLKPTVDMHTLPLNEMLKKLSAIKQRAGVEELSHKSVEPGEKN